MATIGPTTAKSHLPKLIDPSRPQTGVGSVTVPVGWALLAADDDPKLSVLVELGDADPRVVDGYGGWETIARKGRTALTRWQGFAPMTVEVELFFDDLAGGRSVEPAIEVLEVLAGRGPRATGGEPPRLVVNTAGVMPHDVHTYPDRRWVLENIEWATGDDDVIRNQAGDRVRAGCTVRLRQHVDTQRLEDRALLTRQKLAARRKPSRKRYTVKQGETLISIAAKQLGDAGRWTEIVDLNPGLRDPRAVRAGAVIRLP